MEIITTKRQWIRAAGVAGVAGAIVAGSVTAAQAYSGGEGFAADYYIYTGYSSWIPGIDICQ